MNKLDISPADFVKLTKAFNLPQGGVQLITKPFNEHSKEETELFLNTLNTLVSNLTDKIEQDYINLTAAERLKSTTKELIKAYETAIRE